MMQIKKKQKFKMSGFTLIELLAVIIILCAIGTICFPIVEKQIKSSKEKARLSSVNNIIRATEMYIVEENVGDENIFDKIIARIDGNKPTSGEIKIVDDNIGIAVKIDGYCYVKDYERADIIRYERNNCTIEYIDNSGANKPDLLTNMVPIKYDGTNWVYAYKSEDWYDYDSKKWANAVILNSGVTKNVGDTIEESDIALWYVWIPRYKYIIFNGNNGSATEQLINVTFESSTNTTGTVKCHDAINETDSNGDKISEICTDTTQTNNQIVNNTSTYTHPAFCLGTKNEDGTCNGDELTGFWFGKFEISGTETAITIKPNVNSLRNKKVSQFYTAIQGMSTAYGINNGDSHMAKNMEWGAVAYLKQSSYGLGLTDIGINNNSNFITGCGAASGSSQSTTCNAYNTGIGLLASTTGNIYGVYDMSGGAWKYTMGNMVNESGGFYSSGAGFTTDTMPPAKYYDAYTYDTSYTTHARGKLGDATKETLATFGSNTGGWTSDHAYFPSSSNSWFQRGGRHSNGSSAGVFYFNYADGLSNYYASTRAVLSRKP